MVLKIELFRSSAGMVMVLSGNIASPNVQQLKAHLDDARDCVALDLREVRLVDLDTAHFLASLQGRGIELRGLPPYVREWIRLERPRIVEPQRSRANAPEPNNAKDEIMERMLVVVFDNEKKAYEGKSALRQLELEGSITIYAGAVVTKHADGTVSVKQYDDFGPLGTVAGSAIGSLIGLLGGPTGVVIGGLSGLTAGALYDLDNALVGSDFVDDVMQSLSPNKVGIVAEVEEEWTTPVDVRMEALGGTVFRRSLLEVRIAARDEEITVMKGDLAKLKEEMRTADASRKAKLHEKGEQLQAKIDAVQTKAKDRRAQFEARAKAKLEILKKNAAAAGRAIKDLANTPV